MGLVWLSACFRDALGRHQAPRRHRSGISNPFARDHSDRSPEGNGYRDGEQWKHRVLLSEHTISVPVSEKLPYLRDLFTSAGSPFQGRHPTSHSQSGRETLSRFRPVLPLRSPSRR